MLHNSMEIIENQGKHEMRQFWNGQNSKTTEPFSKSRHIFNIYASSSLTSAQNKSRTFGGNLSKNQDDRKKFREKSEISRSGDVEHPT